jgi:hypothetical protein
MNHADAFRRCLIELDVVGICDLWFHVNPHLPQPKNNEEALTTIHYARTQTESIPIGLRCYSHAWLCERGLPSGLPDRLKPQAGRLYPHEVKAVGIAVRAMSEAGVPRARAIEQAMSDAVLDCYADGVTDVDIIRSRMDEARRGVEDR